MAQTTISALGAGFAVANIGAELYDGDFKGALWDVGNSVVSLTVGARMLGLSPVGGHLLFAGGALLNAKLAAEHRQEIATLIDLRFGHGTWQSIINERAKRLREQQEAEKQHRLAKEKHQEELMIGAAVILGLLVALGIFAFLYIKYG